MTIQQLAGSSNGKSSSGISALLGADDGSTGQTQNAGFSTALRNSMAESDKTAPASATKARAEQSSESEVASEPAQDEDVQQETAAAMPGASALPGASQQPAKPLPTAGIAANAEPELAAASAQPAEGLAQAGALAATPVLVPDAMTTSDESGTAAASTAAPLISRLFTTIEPPSTSKEPDRASAFGRGLPYLIGMLRESTSVANAAVTEGAGRSAKGPLTSLQGDAALVGIPWSSHGAAQAHASGATFAQAAGAHEQIPGLKTSADGLFTTLTGVAAEGAALDLAGAAKGAPETSTPATAQPANLAALLGSVGSARDARPFTGEVSGSATPQFQSTHTPGSAAWVQDIGARIEWLQDMKLSKAELYLHPEELGALEISIVSDNDTTSVAFVTQTAAAREIIENTLPRLKELLANQGLQLDQSHVSQQSAQDQRRGNPQGEGRNHVGTAADPLAEPARHGSSLLPSGQIDQYV